MLERIDNLSADVVNLLIYTNSPILQNILKKKLKTNFGIGKYMTRHAENATTLKEVKNDTITPPFGGGTWFVDINADNLKVGDIGKQLGFVTNAAKNVYWFTNYKQYKAVCALDIVKTQGVGCFQLYAGKVYPEDISYIQELMLEKEKRVNSTVLNYLKKNYTYDVDAVCKLFSMIKQGDSVTTTKEVIARIGIGGNTIDSLTIKLLTTNPKTEKGLDKAFSNILILLNDLSYSYHYNTIRTYLLNTVNTIIEIKQLQLMGKYTMVVKDIPEEGFNEEKIVRLRRFERCILEEITLARVLNLKLFLEKYKSFDFEVSLIETISDFLTAIYKNNSNNPSSKEISKKRRYRR